MKKIVTLYGGYTRKPVSDIEAEYNGYVPNNPMTKVITRLVQPSVLYQGHVVFMNFGVKGNLHTTLEHIKR